MANYVFGANVLENLTTGMYRESKIIFREYIQNACDAIDKAIKLSMIDEDEGRIEIWLNENERLISIEDNGTGISEREFESTMKAIAQSDKQIDTEKGFRGIGRLCGIAYCRELIFSSTAENENIISIMKVDAKKLRSYFYGEIKYSAQEVLDNVIEIEKKISDEVKSEHWFKVEMIDINSEDKVLLDIKTVCDYLSFIAPVEYNRTAFYECEKIYNYAKSINFKIEEYKIYLNGQQIFKEYKNYFKTSKGEDNIFDFAFKNFYDSQNKLIAWCWIGLSRFEGVISENVLMRSIRLRKGNIQIGNESTLDNLLRRKSHNSNHYFIGEMFAVDNRLIPNAQRDYFIQNSTQEQFEDEMKKYADELNDIYYGASNINRANNKIKKFENAQQDYERKVQSNLFIDDIRRGEAKDSLDNLEEQSKSSIKKIEKEKQKALENPEKISSKVILRLIEKKLPTNSKSNTNLSVDSNPKINYRSQKLSKLNKNERKLVQKIYNIISDNVKDTKISEELINKIEEALL